MSDKIKQIHDAATERNLDIALDATGAPLERRIKIQTEQGVRELTHKELLILLARRASVEADVAAGKKPKYKKCLAVGCILLIPIRTHGGTVARCAAHRSKRAYEMERARRTKDREKINMQSRARYAANPEKYRERAYIENNMPKRRAKKREWYEKNREKRLAQEKARYAKNCEKIKERVRAYHAKKKKKAEK